MKLNEDQVPGAKLTANLEKLGKNEAIRWLKCRNACNLSKLNLTELREKCVFFQKLSTFCRFSLTHVTFLTSDIFIFDKIHLIHYQFLAGDKIKTQKPG